MRGSLWIIAVLVCMFAVSGIAVSETINDETGTETVVEENHTLPNNQSQAVTLNKADDWHQFVNGSETVQNASSGDTLSENKYNLNETTGELSANDTSVAGEEVLVDYQYESRDDTTALIASVLGLLSPLMPWLIIIAILATLVSFAGRWW